MDNEEVIYSEETKKHIDDIFIQRIGKSRKEGKSYTLIAILITFVVSFIFFYFTFINPSYKKDVYGKYIYIASGFFLLFFSMALYYTFLLSIDDLKLSNAGICVPKRSLKNIIGKEKNFILYSDIEMIQLDYVDEDFRKISILKKDGFKVSFYSYYFNDFGMFLKTISGNAKIKKKYHRN